MRVFRRLGATALGLFVAFGLACSDSAGPAAVKPSALVRVSGDSQGNLTGDQLFEPLTVLVNGSNGQHYSGATVTWTVTAGAATLGSPTASSDSQGFATTTVTLGATPGAISIQASVGGVAPVAFGATACDHPVLALNDTLPGSLAATDCNFGGYFTDFYEVNVPAGPQGVAFTMASGAFETWLQVYLRTGFFVGYDFEIDSPNSSSQFSAILATGNYLLAPSSLLQNSTGAYTMAALSRPAALAGCGLVWVMRGVDVSDSVTAGDCVDSTSGVYYADKVAINLDAGSVLTVAERSTAFDAALFLNNAAGTGVAFNDDSANAGTTTNAYLVYQAPATGVYLLFVATTDSAATGAYTLSIASSTTLTGSPRRDERPQVLRMTGGGLRMPHALPGRTWSRAGT